jgi:coenzyme PQQ synthesis protein D (PqqD)
MRVYETSKKLKGQSNDRLRRFPLRDSALSQVSPAAEHRPQRRSDLTVRIVDGETVILDRRNGLIHQLNRTASFVWERCDGSYTTDKLATRLVETFEVDPQTAANNVTKLIEQLQKLNLLLK